eukprot:358989-Chlamydomonas_euryale.AAC.1
MASMRRGLEPRLRGQHAVQVAGAQPRHPHLRCERIQQPRCKCSRRRPRCRLRRRGGAAGATL